MRKSLLCAGAAALCMTGSSWAAPRLIAVDSSRALYELDMNTGVRTAIGTVSSNAGTTGGLAYDRTNGIMYLTSTSLDALFTLNVGTGAATLVGDYGADPDILVHGIEYDDSTGTLYAGSRGNLYTVDKTNGLLTLMGSTGLSTTGFINLGYDSDNDVMYATHTSTDSLYTINRANGAVTLIGAMTGTSNPHGVAYDFESDRMFLVDSSTDNLYKIDLATGAPTLIGFVGTSNLLGLAYIPEIPEPGSLCGALGFAGIAAMRRRRSV